MNHSTIDFDIREEILHRLKAAEDEHGVRVPPESLGWPGSQLHMPSALSCKRHSAPPPKLENLIFFQSRADQV